MPPRWSASSPSATRSRLSHSWEEKRPVHRMVGGAFCVCLSAHTSLPSPGRAHSARPHVRGGVECGSTLHAVFDLLLGGRGPAVPAHAGGPALGVLAPLNAAVAAGGRGDGHAVDLSRAARPASVRASFRPLSGTATPRVIHPAWRAAW